MFLKDDTVKCLPTNSLYKLVGEETGVVTNQIIKDGTQHISVVFYEYGSEQGLSDASHYELTNEINNGSTDIQHEYVILQAANLIKTQQIYAKSMLNK